MSVFTCVHVKMCEFKCLSVLVCERDRVRERDRQTDRQTERERERTGTGGC